MVLIAFWGDHSETGYFESIQCAEHFWWSIRWTCWRLNWVMIFQVNWKIGGRIFWTVWKNSPKIVSKILINMIFGRWNITIRMWLSNKKSGWVWLAHRNIISLSWNLFILWIEVFFFCCSASYQPYYIIRVIQFLLSGNCYQPSVGNVLLIKPFSHKIQFNTYIMDNRILCVMTLRVFFICFLSAKTW